MPFNASCSILEMPFSRYGRNGDWEKAMSLLVEMQADGVRPDAVTYGTIVAAVSSRRAKRVEPFTIKTVFFWDPNISTGKNDGCDLIRRLGRACTTTTSTSKSFAMLHACGAAHFQCILRAFSTLFASSSCCDRCCNKSHSSLSCYYHLHTCPSELRKG